MKILSADTVGYEEGEAVKIEIFKKETEELIDEVEGIVSEGRVEIEWIVNYKKDNKSNESDI